MWAIRYIVVSAMILVAVLGIPLIFPGKSNPFKGKVTDISAEEMPS